MPSDTFCRWLPDTEVVEAFVHAFLLASRVLHARHPDTLKHTQPGEKLDIGQDDVGFKLLCSYFPEYRNILKAGKPKCISSKPMDPVVEEFKKFIESDGEIFAGFNTMFDQAPKPKEEGTRKIENYLDLMDAFDTILSASPTYAEGEVAMVAGVPFYGILARFCNTPAGYNMFTHPGVNLRFHNMFSKWQKFLESRASRSVLHAGENGWLSDKALASAVVYAGGPENSPHLFPDYYLCDPDDPHYGYESYDAYFVRELRATKRAVTEPDNNSIVNSPCSAEVYKLYSPLTEFERFWMKKTPYSLAHMLGQHEYTKRFVNGTLVQAMLGSRDYHRWRSPIAGTVKATRLIPGTYYASRLQNPPSADPDPSSPSPAPAPDPDPVSRSQDFVSAISTRALIFIEADNTDLGLVGFVGVGLGEVSTCNVIVYEGQHLEKGDEIGQFHFGGSTFCLLFEPHVEVTPINEDLVGSKVHVGNAILTVAKKSG